MIVKTTSSAVNEERASSRSVTGNSYPTPPFRAQMPMISVFTLIHTQTRRSIIVLSDQCCRLSFLARCIAIFLLVSHPATWRDRFMITGLRHFSLTYG